ncbi:MAG: prepilin-type N-terminal cleavage/methylation domain-containing protein [Candidatus Brocadiia bacterium]
MSSHTARARVLRPAWPQGRGRRGFTLIEILLAIGILAVGITAVLFLFTMGVRSHRRAIDRSRAAMLADTVLNQIKAELRADLPAHYHEDDEQNLELVDPETGEPVSRATHADFPEFVYDVSFTRLLYGNYYIVRVTVRTGDAEAPPDATNSETFETILRRKNF